MKKPGFLDVLGFSIQAFQPFSFGRLLEKTKTMPNTKITRRTFAKAGAAAALTLTAAQSQKVLGANDRIRLGFIGVANRGGQLLGAFLDHPDMEVAALCDVCQTTLDQAKQRVGGKADTCGDFRKLIDRQDLDAVVIATPDHWHAVQTVHAAERGKHVYVEKPACHNVFEGRKMVEAARKYDRIVQTGTQSRSSREGVAAAVLSNLNVDLDQIHERVEESVRKGKATIALGELPYTSRAKKVLEFAMAEARDFNHSYVGTEHLLLGLLRVPDGIAAMVLSSLELEIESVRKEVLAVLGVAPGAGALQFGVQGVEVGNAVRRVRHQRRLLQQLRRAAGHRQDRAG